MMTRTTDQVLQENEELRRRLEDAEEALHAIRAGEVDAVLVEAEREQVLTLESADRPYRLLVEQMPHGAATLTVEGAILYCNRRFANLLKRPLQALLGKLIHDFVVPDSRPLFEALLRDGQAGDVHGEVTLQRADGTLVPVYLGVGALQEGVFGLCLIVTDLTEQEVRKKAELAVKAMGASEERLRLALEAGRIGTWEWDIGTNRVTWSSSLEAIHGLPAGTFPGTFEAYQNDIHPEDRDRVLRSIQQTLQLGKEHRIDYRVVWPDGTVHWVEGRGKLFSDAQGRPMRIVGICQDITERRRAEEGQALLAAVVASSEDAIVSKSLDGMILSWNAGAEVLFGYTASEVIGRPITLIIPPERQDEEHTILEQVRQGKRIEHYETVRLSKHGRRIDVSLTVSPVRDRTGRVIGASKVARDITARKETQEALRQSAARFRNLLLALPAAVYTTDREGRITFYNDQAAQLWGRRPEIGKDMWCGSLQILRPDGTPLPHDQCPMAVALHEGRSVRGQEIVVERPDGTRVCVLPHPEPLRDASGEVVGAVNMLVDITDRKRAEQWLREAHGELGRRVKGRTAELDKVNEALKAEIDEHKQTEAARREFMQQLINAKEAERHHIARELHDQMGQHLTALILGLKVLRDATPESSPARERLLHLQELADLIGKEVHHVALELRPTALDDFGLHTTLVNYVEEWSERSGVGVDFHSTGLEGQRLPSPIETALYRMVQEGLTNVLKHAQARRVSLILQRFPHQALAILEDDGRGFDADAAMNSCGPRHRLGLLGMRERVALVGGTLTIESTPGRGTTIFARIPLPADGEEASDG